MFVSPLTLSLFQRHPWTQPGWALFCWTPFIYELFLQYKFYFSHGILGRPHKWRSFSKQSSHVPIQCHVWAYLMRYNYKIVWDPWSHEAKYKDNHRLVKMEWCLSKVIVRQDENKTGHLRLQILQTIAVRKASIMNNMLVVTILKACIVKLGKLQNCCLWT